MIQCRECGGNISSEALTCPHCGCPQKKAETQYYELEKAQETDCYGARFLRALAYILWIGGLILAIATSIGTETNYYGRSTTTFLWSNFVNVLSNYAIYGCAAWSVSLLFADIHGINVALNSLKLVQKVQKEEQPSTASKKNRPIVIPKATAVVTPHSTSNEDQIESPLWNCGE